MNFRTIGILYLCMTLVFACSPTEDTSEEDAKTETVIEETEHPTLSPIEQHGNLQVKGHQLLNEHGEVAQLRGMSFFWSQWQGQFYNKTIVDYLADDWQCDIIRAAMGVNHGGYIENPEVELQKVDQLIQAAVDNGLYVIIDYHAHTASEDVESAVDFFSQMAKKYGHLPNVIYEIYNEPLEDSWTDVLVPYAQSVIATIRQHDPDNLVLCGTRTWSQRVDEVAQKPLEDNNVAYVLHFYAGTHKQDLRDIGDRAIAAGTCIFVSEFGVINANGDGDINYASTKEWMQWMDKHQLSWCNWAVSEKEEGASIFLPGTPSNQTPTAESLTESGLYLRNILRNRNYDQP